MDPFRRRRGHICWVSGPPREKVRRLVSSAVFQDPETWQRQAWRRNDEMDQSEGSGDPRMGPHAAEHLLKQGLLMSSLD